jgi:hypothetical protein
MRAIFGIALLMLFVRKGWGGVFSDSAVPTGA